MAEITKLLKTTKGEVPERLKLIIQKDGVKVKQIILNNIDFVILNNNADLFKYILSLGFHSYLNFVYYFFIFFSSFFGSVSEVIP